MNRAEYRVYPTLERAVAKYGRGHRVMAQTSVGELIRPDDATGSTATRHEAFWQINAKRFDFCIIGRGGHLVAAIEYQGRGHFQNNWRQRDEIKRRVVQQAGARFIELSHDVSATQVETLVRDLLTQAPPLPPGNRVAPSNAGHIRPPGPDDFAVIDDDDSLPPLAAPPPRRPEFPVEPE